MKTNLHINYDFESEECCKCGVLFFMPATLVSNLRTTKNTFFCPNGHGQSYRESTTDAIKAQLEEKKKQYEIAQERIRNLSNELATKNKPKRRAMRKAV